MPCSERMGAVTPPSLPDCQHARVALRCARNSRLSNDSIRVEHTVGLPFPTARLLRVLVVQCPRCASCARRRTAVSRVTAYVHSPHGQSISSFRFLYPHFECPVIPPHFEELILHESSVSILAYPTKVACGGSFAHGTALHICENSRRSSVINGTQATQVELLSPNFPARPVEKCLEYHRPFLDGIAQLLTWTPRRTIWGKASPILRSICTRRQSGKSLQVQIT